MSEHEEKAAVYSLGQQIGYGRMMQLGEECWRETQEARGMKSGAEHTTGPCAAMLVPCPCKDRVECDWCCGTGRVTRRVARAMRGCEQLEEMAEHLTYSVEKCAKFRLAGGVLVHDPDKGHLIPMDLKDLAKKAETLLALAKND